MRILSLRTRILVGAVLWTFGLTAIVWNVLHLVFTNPSARIRLHWSVRFWPEVTLLAAVCMFIGFLQVRRGLSPINQLRERLATVHKGITVRISGHYPTEVQPLVDDLNVLLEEREQRVAKAIARAGDLAHGLKTPLAVLAYEAEQARAAGHENLAKEIDQQINIMRRQIDYHLAHARASASSSAVPAARTSIAASAEALVRTLERLHAERDLCIGTDVPASHFFRGQREDLDEMIGNLLDNACKWARREVRITCARENGELVIAVDDDGDGIEPSMREVVIQRGIRATEAAQGSGLGLAIVRDLAEIHGGTISLGQSPMGGTRALLTLPSHDLQ
jgi:signal transduction histidine kinase